MLLAIGLKFGYEILPPTRKSCISLLKFISPKIVLQFLQKSYAILVKMTLNLVMNELFFKLNFWLRSIESWLLKKNKFGDE
jgi:hypothetical protein